VNILRPTIHITLLLALALGYASAWSRVDPAEYPQSLVPEETHADTANEVTKRLTRGHYRKVLFDDALSSKVFDRYLAVLDPARVYFTAADIDEFERYRHQIDDLLRDGELGPAYRIYNRYQVRLAEQLAYMVNHLESGLDDMDFGILDEIEIDRREAAWPADRTEQQALWFARLKNAVLGLRLTDKPDPEIVKLLTKRYQSQLNRLRQGRSEDAFQAFINALAYNFDPHTAYLSPRRSEDFSIDMNLSLEGIGAALQLDNEYTKVVRIIPGGPAFHSKQIQPSDRIVSVGQGKDGELVDIVGWRPVTPSASKTRPQARASSISIMRDGASALASFACQRSTSTPPRMSPA